ncbi:unnamed protein product [Mytilus edulis]|uniref:Uncharacterized protein n=1 Tax=Mytilus edulis TaxID=6550 RepID=A0A8S3U293_MYTED|nr:unnamed protein product [Mytilus edulis]
MAQSACMGVAQDVAYASAIPRTCSGGKTCENDESSELETSQAKMTTWAEEDWSSEMTLPLIEFKKVKNAQNGWPRLIRVNLRNWLCNQLVCQIGNGQTGNGQTGSDQTGSGRNGNGQSGYGQMVDRMEMVMFIQRSMDRTTEMSTSLPLHPPKIRSLFLLSSFILG